MDELRDEIAKLFPQAGRSTPRWSVKKQGFISNLQKILAILPESNLIDRNAFTDEQEKVAASLEMIEELYTQNSKLQKQIADLEELKDKDAVQEIKFRALPSDEQYNTFLRTVQEELSGFSPVEVRCLYAFFVGDWWHPSHDDWGDWGKEIESALKSNWINQHSDETLYEANKSHPRYQSAINAIEKLGAYIGEMDKNLKSLIQEKEKYEVDIFNLEYWKQALGHLIY